MIDLGVAKHYLGAEFEYHSFGIWVHQQGYITKLLEKFEMLDSTPSSLPMDPGCTLRRYMGTWPVDLQLYRSLVGSLIYATNTRLDISYAVSCVSRYMDNPEEAHWRAANQILRYLKCAIHLGLHFRYQQDHGFYAFADADWGLDLDTRRSTFGLIYKIGDSPIDWSSKLQPTMSLSTTEAKYRVLTDASKDVIYLRRLLIELGLDTQ
jgi:hypothetical protein